MTTILPNPFQETNENDSCISNKCAKYIFQISKQIKQTKKQEVAGKAEIIKGFLFFFFQGLINLLLEKALYIISKWAKSPREGDLGGGGKLVTYLTDYILLLSYTPFLFSLLLTNHEHER